MPRVVLGRPATSRAAAAAAVQGDTDTQAYLQHAVLRDTAAHLKLMCLQSMATAKSGCVAAWLWLCGCVAVWLCGCGCGCGCVLGQACVAPGSPHPLSHACVDAGPVLPHHRDGGVGLRGKLQLGAVLVEVLDALVASVHRRYGRPRGWWTIGQVVEATTVFEAVHVDHPDEHRFCWVLPPQHGAASAYIPGIELPDELPTPTPDQVSHLPPEDRNELDYHAPCCCFRLCGHPLRAPARVRARVGCRNSGWYLLMPLRSGLPAWYLDLAVSARVLRVERSMLWALLKAACTGWR